MYRRSWSMESRVTRLRRRKRSNIGGGRLNRTAEENSLGRIRYRRKRDGELVNQKPGNVGIMKPKKSGGREATMKTRAIIFLEQTPFGELARRVREQQTDKQTDTRKLTCRSSANFVSAGQKNH